MTFSKLSLATAFICATLFILLLFIPEFIYWIFSIHDDETARLMSRRASMLFLGIAIITFTGRNSAHSDLRQSVVLGIAVTMTGLATLGLFEFIRGYAGAGILLAASTELFFSFAYLHIWKSNR